ncbi:MAG: hypothetical protein J0H62_05185, partial [Rhizobiales bacterium]|nr:hypothetical protein [Hyphomicrobiales bacterium]
RSPFAPAVDIALAGIRAEIEDIRLLCSRGRFIETLEPLKTAHDAIRYVRSELELSADTPWGRELAAIRSAASDLLEVELDMTLGAVRRLLRPRASPDGPATLNAREVDEVEGRVAFAAACRNYANELAVNLVAPRVYADLQTYIDNTLSTMIETLRSAHGGERTLRQSQVDAAVRFAAKLFGSDYASLLNKAAAIALAHKRPARA